QQCAARELREEIGLDHCVSLVRVLGPIRDTLYGGIYEIHLFHQRWLGGKVALNHEHTEFAWVGKERVRDYDVMDGIDEDILYLGIWPREFLREEKLPR
ncbi:MAG: NUDIX domain-containing protein, partial [Gammaproteobacteria bacterium]|nr:NUDIX domain-containing protein [Gammaproteobacteria bacterium]